MEEFHKLKVSFSSSNEGHSSKHTIYCKKHAVRQSSKITPNLKTLFSLGWPPYCNPQDVESLFSRVGHVINVYLQTTPGPVDLTVDGRKNGSKFRVGYVVFAGENDLENALTLCHTPNPISCPLSLVGLSKWTHDYLAQRPSNSTLEEMAEEGVACYDRQQEAAELAKKMKAGIPDKDGWITVVRKTPRYKDDDGNGKRRRKKKQAKTGLHVYPWQLRESQREEVADLRRKFEADKEKVAAMRAQRKFKPF